MAVTLVAVRKVLNGVGGETFFDVPEIQVIQAEDVVVYLQTIATGVIENSGLPLTLNVNYNIVLTTPNDLPSLFRINLDATTFPTGLPATQQLIVVRRTEMTQDQQFAAGDPFPESVQELVLDKATLIAQEAQEIIGRPQDSKAPRALVAHLSDNDASLDLELPPVATRASQYLGFDADGNPIALAAPAGTTAVDAFWAPILLLSTKETSLEALGISFDTAAPVAAGDFTGELWFETDRRVVWQWNGAAWEEILTKLVADTAAVRGAVTAAGFGVGFFYETDTRSIHFSDASTWVELFPDRDAANADFLLGADATGLLVEYKNPQTTLAALPRGYIEGCVMTVGTDADHDTHIGIGAARDNDDNYNLINPAVISKELLTATGWVAGGTPGSPQPGFPNALTLTSGTWYHVFLIGNPTTGAIDAGYDDNLLATNLLADATGYTEYRRIGSVFLDGSANIIPYTQYGDEFLWDTPRQDVSTTLNVAAQTPTVSTPPLVKTLHIGDWSVCETGVVGGAERVLGVLVTALDQNDVAPASPGTNISIGATNGAHTFDFNGSRITTRTNLASSVRWRGTETTTEITVTCLTHGYYDQRGHD